MAEVLDGAPAPGKRRQSFFDTALKVESKAKARATAFAQKKRKERADALQAVEDSRKVTIDMLASDWLGKSMADAEELDERINPVNLLGMYLMRNNPKYSNFAEASPYMKSLKDEEERVAARNAKILKIPLLWAVAQGWLGGDEQKINARSIVNGFLNFHDYLTDHGKSEYAVVVNDLFAGVPKGEIFAEDLTWTADQLLDSLTSWTEQVRDHINAEELMKMLREHLVEWFDTDPSLQGQERKRYRELFQEIDFYSEGNLNIDLVMRLVGAFSDSAALPEEAKEHYIHALPHWLPSSLTNVQDDADDSASLANFGDQLAAAAPAAEGEAAAPAASEGGDEIAPAAAAAPAESEEAPAAAAADAEGGDEAAAAPDNEGGAAAPAAADAEGGAAETEARESIHSEFPDDVPVRIKSGKRRQSVYVAQE
eukprot:gene14718-31335_t